MMRRRTMPTAALLAVAAMLAAGCSSNGSHDASGPSAGQHDTDAVSGSDPDAAADPDSGAPGVNVPGGDEDEGEAAAIAPGYEHGTKVTALQINGYRATINLLGLPSSGPAKKPWEELGSPHPIKGGDDATTVGAQTTSPAGKTPPLDVNVAGLDFAHFGAGHPPDTSGAVGPDNFIQTVNTSIGIYDKTGKQQNAFSF